MTAHIRAILVQPVFWVIILFGLIAQVIPYLLTMNAPAADGNTIAGFPFTFYSFGGMCGWMDGRVGQCPASFVPLHVFFDAAVVIGLAALISYRRYRGSAL